MAAHLARHPRPQRFAHRSSIGPIGGLGGLGCLGCLGALETAVAEYERLSAERATLETRLTQLEHSIATLTKLCGFEPSVPLGLTDACRLVLRNSPVALTPLEVRAKLKSIGVDLDKYSNALASIHTVLKRMHESGEIVERDREEDARTAYLSIEPQVGVVFERGRRRAKGQGLTPPKHRKPR